MLSMTKKENFIHFIEDSVSILPKLNCEQTSMKIRKNRKNQCSVLL